MIFKLILWYALLKGVRAGLRKAPPMTVTRFDELLKQYYVRPIEEYLNTSVGLLSRISTGTENTWVGEHELSR